MVLQNYFKPLTQRINVVNYGNSLGCSLLGRFLFGRSLLGCSLLGRSLIDFSNLLLGRSFRSFYTSSSCREDFNYVNIKNLNLKDLRFSLGETYIYLIIFLRIYYLLKFLWVSVMRKWKLEKIV